jgi:hypothetical protein
MVRYIKADIKIKWQCNSRILIPINYKPKRYARTWRRKLRRKHKGPRMSMRVSKRNGTISKPPYWKLVRKFLKEGRRAGKTGSPTTHGERLRSAKKSRAEKVLFKGVNFQKM